MPTSFSLTLVVGISYSQLFCEVWTETQIHKTFFYSEGKIPPFSLLCLCHLSYWGCCSKTQFARKPFYTMENEGKWGSRRQWRSLSLFPCPLDRCNYPMWDLTRGIKWMNRIAKLKFPEAHTLSSGFCGFFYYFHQKWSVPQHNYLQ